MSDQIFEEQFFGSIKQTIRRLIGFDAFQYSDNFLKRRILIRMKANRIDSCKRYETKLIEDEKEQKELLKNLTIHVTEFFRDKTFWEFCREKFFPYVLERFSGRETINIWSAGCSTGQEPISILITFLEVNKNIMDKIRIIGTDIDENVLSIAKKGEYDAFGAKGLSQEVIGQYFIRCGGILSLREGYRKNIEFLRHDILTDRAFGNIDLMFCRNTVIYFSKESKEELYMGLYDALGDGSFFVLGKTETLLGKSRKLFKPYNLIERVFEKGDGG